MNLLQLVQQATGELGLPVPTAVAGNTANDTVQQFSLLNAAGMELLREAPWERLTKEYRFTTQALSTTGTTVANSAIVTVIPSTTGLDATYMVTGTGIPQDTYVLTVDSATQVTLSQAVSTSGTLVALTFGKTKYTLPSDYDRQIDRTHYDKSKRWEMVGPSTAQQWQWLKSAFIATGPRIRYRILGNTFQIWPLVATAEYLGYEYVSNAFASSLAGVAQSLFIADTDTCVFPDRLMVTALKLKYFSVKGFDTTPYMREYMVELERAKADDAGSQTLSMAPRLTNLLIGIDQIPDAGYGS